MSIFDLSEKTGNDKYPISQVFRFSSLIFQGLLSNLALIGNCLRLGLNGRVVSDGGMFTLGMNAIVPMCCQLLQIHCLIYLFLTVLFRCTIQLRHPNSLKALLVHQF